MFLYSFSKSGKELIKSGSNFVSEISRIDNKDNNTTLVLITPHRVEKKTVPNNWRNIHNSWCSIIRETGKDKLEHWRNIKRYGVEVIPGLRIFREKNKSEDFYFVLLSKIEPIEAISEFNNILSAIFSWRHLANNRLFIHSAGIIVNNSAFVFSGPSGAGKTTVSEFSSSLGYKVINDDHVVLKKKGNQFYVSDRSLLLGDYYLNAMFFLQKSNDNKLTLLGLTDFALNIMNRNFESFSNPVLKGKLLQTALKMSSEVARSVPGYEMRFRKSPEFWEVIKNEFGIT